MPLPVPGTGRRVRFARRARCETAPVSAPGTRRIDLNADLGEGFGVWRLGDDDALLGIVSSANVACGFHAGDPSTMRRVCTRAVAGGVAIGAQVSYRDLAGFGRRFLDVEPAELADDLLYQLAALDGIARSTGGRVSYVKPHGALYNAAVTARGARPGDRRRRPGLRPPAARAGAARLGAAAGRRRRPGCAPSPRGSPTGATRPPAPWCPARSPARSCTIPRWWPRGRCGWRPTASSRRWTGRRCSCPSSRSACTATPRAPSSWPGRCARRWRPPG